MADWVGWVATAMFGASYFFKKPVSLRLVQCLAAILWVGYGIAIAAHPVIVANLVVGTLAAYSAWKQHAGEKEGV